MTGRVPLALVVPAMAAGAGVCSGAAAVQFVHHNLSGGWLLLIVGNILWMVLGIVIGNTR